MVNLRRLDLVSLQLLVHCREHGSISAAASHSNLSVMGASERLRRFENALGKPLFVRHRRGLEPTEAGLLAIRAARTVLDVIFDMGAAVGATEPAANRAGANSGRRGKQMQAS